MGSFFFCDARDGEERKKVFFVIIFLLSTTMTDTWDRTLFDKELKAILESKLPVSASKITGLQSLATAHPKVSFVVLFHACVLNLFI